MTYTAITLTDAASGLSSVLKPRDGVAVTTLDVQPGVRVVSDPVAGGDGARDTTEFIDAAAATLSLRLSTSAAGVTPEQFLDEIAPLLAPYRRPALVVSNDAWPGDRQMIVRFDSKTAPVDNPISTDVAISWKVPAGVWTAVADSDFSLPASFQPTTGLHMTPTGLHVTTTGIHLPAANAASDSEIAVGGGVRPPWRARLYGPCTGPKLANDTNGGDLIFTDALVLAAGQYVEISSARTALLLSDPAQPVLNLLDFANSTWWDLEPGVSNLIRYHPTSGAASGAVLSFSPAYLP